MTDHIPINPCAIPQFTGDLDALEQNHKAITAAAGTFRDAGANVDSEFQGLSAFYSAPEAAQLFATTHPVKTDSDFFADQLESAAKALGEFVTEARPLVARLKQLQAEATTFSNKILGDEHWKDDGKKTAENNALVDAVNATAGAFWAAERACATKIRALYGAPPLRADDGSHADDMHGYLASDLNKAQDLPWGSHLEETHRAWEVGYWVKSFVWDGIVVDGIVGTVRGLGTLVGVDGADAAGKAWTGLAKLGTGLALSINPGTGVVFWMADDKAMPAWLRDSRNAMKETGKALVAWDEWGKNPARAAGAVTFNVLTAIFTDGAGTAAKTGTAAKVISVAGKAGRLIDPMTYVGQAAGKAGSLAFSKLKIGELFANFGKADGAFPKVDDVVWKDLPKADTPGVTFPHPTETLRLPDDALGRPQYYDKTTHQLLDHTGTPKQDLTAVPKGNDHPLAEVPKREEVTVGGGNTHSVTGTADNAAHTPGGTATHTPGGASDKTAHNSHTGPGGGGHQPTHAADSGSGAGHGGHGSSGGSGHDAGPHDPADNTSGHGGDPHDPADPGTGQPTTGSGSGHGGDTAIPHQDPPKVEDLPRLPKGGRIPEHTFDHVLQGELKYDPKGNPKVSGYHFRPDGRDLNPHMVKVPSIIEIDHKTGLTTGNVWMRDPRTGEMVMKRAKTTFFPPGWTEKQVRRAMTKSFENGRVVDLVRNKWRGEWKGIRFEGYFDPITGDAKTIYPLMPK
ncbi:EndoU domain-containing protein [Streptomyces sp. NPDC029216]|uniref:EndoU domain-containing protein n=1 Tax=Streptomyces sp. NPDC029216 TaxID=3154701 RepID=UPI0033C61CAF